MLTDAVRSSLERYRLFTSYDVEETQTRIGEVMQPHRLKPLSRMSYHSGYMNYLQLPSIGLGSIGFGDMGLDVDGIADYYLIIFCPVGHAQLQVRDRRVTIEGAVGLCASPGDALSGEFSPDAEQFIIKIDRQVLRLHTGMRRPRLQTRIDLRDDDLAAWAGLIRSMLVNPRTIDLLKDDQRVSRDFENLFFSTLISSNIVNDEQNVRGIAPNVVRRAEEFIEENFAERISLDDIAAAAGVPTRTLLEAFQRFRETSPVRHLRQRRFDAARQRLLTQPDTSTIVDVALSVGFSHQGRFAVEYAQRYGERPSDTLRRGRTWRPDTAG